MRVAGIIHNSVVNGIGIRDVLFLQGCDHHCVGCHNPNTWSHTGGEEYTIDELVKEFESSANDITISGGEPLLQFQELYELMERLYKEQGKRFWLYTGFRYGEIPSYMLLMLVGMTDVIVDGRFEQDKKDLTLQFRGSSNQRLIDLKQSLLWDEIKLWEDKR